MKIYGLTGGAGSGKSEAAKRFIERGIPVLDADVLGHDALEPGGAVEKSAVEAFGESILTEGTIDREKLGALVFRDPEARGRLNAIVHPAIAAEIARRCAALAAEGHETVLVDAALLAEDGAMPAGFEGLILVTCPADVRVARLVDYRGLDRALAEGILKNQRPPEEKIPLANWVVENDGPIEGLYQQVDHVAEELLNHGR